LVSILGELYKSCLIFCKKCNIYPYDYYTEEKFLKTGEEAIYAHHMKEDVIIPKFLAFLFEGNINKDGDFIEEYKIVSLIETETIIKGIKYSLVVGLCSPTKIHLTSFLKNYQLDYLQWTKFNSYYYDGFKFK